MSETIGGLAIAVDLKVDPKSAEAQWAKAAEAAKAPAQRVAADAQQAQAQAADASAARWESALGGLRNVVVGIATAASGAIAGLAASVFNSALSIDRQARSLGVSTDEIQRMRYAAEQAGLEGNELGEAMGGLVSRVQAAADGGGDAARRFEEMGLAITDANGETLSADQLFRNAADALAAMGPGTEQTAAAIALFGEKGRLLLPVLSQGSAGLNRMGAEFDELGGGLDADTIASMQRTRAEFERFKLSVMAEVMPAVRSFIGVVESFARRARPTIVAIREWFSDSHNLRTATIALTGVVTALGVASAEAAVASVIAWAPVIGTIALVAAGIAGLALGVDDLVTTLEGGDSVTRRFLNGLLGTERAQSFIDGINQRLDNLVASFELLVASARLMGEAFREAGNAAYDALGPLQPLLDNLSIAVDWLLTRLTESLPQLVGSLAQVFGGPLGQVVVQASGNSADTSRQATRLINSATSGLANSRSAYASSPASIAASSLAVVRDSAPAVSKTVNSTSRVDVRVNGVVDESFFERTRGVIREEMDAAHTNALGDLVDEGE